MISNWKSAPLGRATTVRKALFCAALAGLASFAAGAAVPPSAPPAVSADLAAACEGRQGWADPAPPAHLFGDTWYVGTCGVTVLLVTSDAGHVLIDGGPVEAAPLVAANITALGFEPKDVRWIISSHEHDDHVAAIPELKRLTGARFAALDAAAPALTAGKPRADDPQRAVAKDFPPIAVDRTLRDGGTLRLGKLRFTVRATPMHSHGSASWTWQSCVKGKCTVMTYADSASAVSAPDYRFRDHPDRVAAARRGLARIGSLSCGILITPHPFSSNMFERMAGRAPLADPQACRSYAAEAERRLEARLASEAK